MPFSLVNFLPKSWVNQRLFGFVVFQIKIIHTPKANENPTHGVFMDNAAKNPIVAIIQVIKNQITVLMINQIYIFKILKKNHMETVSMWPSSLIKLLPYFCFRFSSPNEFQPCVAERRLSVARHLQFSSLWQYRCL